MNKISNKLMVFTLSIFTGVSLVGCGQSEEPENKLTQLEAPVVSLDLLTISWDAIEHASGYSINFGNKEILVNDLSYTFGQNEEKAGVYPCSVKALGDNVSYSDSLYSNSVEVLIEFDAPVITLKKKEIEVELHEFWLLIREYVFYNYQYIDTMCWAKIAQI